MAETKKLSELLTPAFYGLWRSTFDKNILTIVEKGGRASGKTVDISIVLIQLVMRYEANALVVRKVGNTLYDSVYQDLKKATELSGVAHLFDFKRSPMEIIFKPMRNKISFRGADDPDKIKGLANSSYPYAWVWFEEAAEFRTEEEISVIISSIVREKLKEPLQYKIFLSYNPPKRKQNWVNKKYESQFIDDRTIVHHSTYLDNPYISDEFIARVEATKANNPRKYEHEFLGKPIGSGVQPFENLKFETISDDFVANADNIRSAVDFGYATDPLAFVRWHYDKKHKTIYALDELYGQKISNRKLAEWLESRGYSSDEIFADSAEPKSIAELKQEFGVPRIKGVKKGPDSVEFGERWLDDLEAIVIDPKRTPKIAWEFENIDYQVDRDGNPKARLVDKDNHAIDATRYAFSEDMYSKKTHVATFKGVF